MTAKMIAVLVSWCAAASLATSPSANGQHIVGHRGLIHDAPENSLSGFAACLELRLGFEVDVRRSKDGQLVCVHDATLERTTNGKGKVGEQSLAELKKLDAGSWLHSSYSGERVPTLAEVLSLARRRGHGSELILLDLKINDEKLPAEVAQLATTAEVVGQCVCIGETITDAKLRRALRSQSKTIGVAVLAEKAEDLDAALKDEAADWVYVRFVPSSAEVAKARQAGKKVIVVGKVVMGREVDNWKRAKEAGVAALLTDYPLECRQSWQEKKSR